MDHRTTILEKLASARRLRLERVHFAVPGVALPPGGEFLPVPRLIVMLAGAKTVRLPLVGGAARVRLETGDMLYCLPETWEKHDWGGCYEMLCVVPRKDFLRMSFYTRAAAAETSRPMPVFLHTGLPYSETLRDTIRALNSAVGLADGNIIRHLGHAVLGLAETECRRTAHDAGGRPAQLFNRIRNWTANSFQEDISRDLVARVFGISPGYVSQLFQAHGKCSFQHHLSECRLSHARDLLATTDLAVYQIAEHCGFRSSGNFVRRFREHHGLPPAKYRAAVQAGNESP